MRKIHLWAGGAGVIAFLITGQILLHHQPPLSDMSDPLRLMHRSRHIYILASGLVNLMLGLYMERRVAGWRLVVQATGSCLAIASIGLLILAFAVEPDGGFQPDMWRSGLGLQALFAGCMAHLLSYEHKSD